MPTLYTFTANLLAETTAVFTMPKTGQTVRAIGGTKFKVGGKGVNVSVAAKELGANTVAAIFPAGEIGARCKKYLDGKVEYISVELPGQTREGLVCIDEKTGKETTFLGADIPVGEDAFEKMAQLLEDKIRPGDIFAFCGSFPGWKSRYADRLSGICKSKNARICLDTYGAPLEDFAKTNADLLKINRAEFLALLKSAAIPFGGDLEDSVRKFHTPARMLAVTDGPNPAVFRDGDDIFKVSPPEIKEVSATGCGDITLATLIVEMFLKGKSARESFSTAVRTASAAAATREITTTMC